MPDYTHVVVLRLKDDTTAEQKASIVKGLRALPAQIPQIQTYRAGLDLGLDPSGCHIGIVGTFESPENYDVYAKHDAHVGLITEQIKPVLSKRAAVQFTRVQLADPPQKHPGDTTPPTLTHCVLLKLKEDVTPEQRQDVLDGLATLPPTISQIQAYRIGPDAGKDPAKFDIALVGDFNSVDDYKSYAGHAAHIHVITRKIKPFLVERVAVQFSASDCPADGPAAKLRLPRLLDMPDYTHVVVLRLKDDTTAEQKASIVKGLRALPAQIPQIQTYRAGLDLGLDPSGCHIGIVGTFESPENYDVYAKHDAHVGLITEQIKPVLSKRAAVQFTRVQLADPPQKHPGDTTPPTLTHCVLLKLKEDVTPEQRQDVLDGLATLPPTISQIQAYRIGPDAGKDPAKFDIALVGDFNSVDDYKSYAGHAAHIDVITRKIKPFLVERVAVQFSASDCPADGPAAKRKKTSER